jgi:plasmid stabilization system protein ParE
VNVEILPQAQNDLFEGFCFYEDQSPGLGERFRREIYAAIDSLQNFGGIHRKLGPYHRLLASPFPYAVYYRVERGTCHVDAIIDCRRDPDWIRERLGME